MKILLLTYSCSPDNGSEEKVGWQWAVQLAQKKQDVVVITKYEPGKKKIIDEYIEQNNLKNLRIEYIDMNDNRLFSFINKKFGTMNFRIFIYQFFLYSKVKKLIYNEQFDILHQVTPVNFRVPFLSSKFKNINIPTVLGPVGGGQVLKNWMYEYLSKKSIQRYRKFLNGIVIRLPFVNYNLKHASKIFAGNEDTKKLIDKRINVKCIYFSDTGIMENEIVNNKYIRNTNEGPIKILWVGRLVPLKGLPLLLNTLPKIKDLSNLQFVIVGGEDSEIRKYSNMAEKLELGNVKFLGKIPHEKMAEVYRCADAFIFTSMIETSGSVLLEAASAGLPIILSDINGKNIFGDTGAIYLDYKSKETAEKSIINSLEQIINYNLRSRLSNESINVARENCWNVRAERMLSEYKDLIKEESYD